LRVLSESPGDNLLIKILIVVDITFYFSTRRRRSKQKYFSWTRTILFSILSVIHGAYIGTYIHTHKCEDVARSIPVRTKWMNKSEWTYGVTRSNNGPSDLNCFTYNCLLYSYLAVVYLRHSSSSGDLSVMQTPVYCKLKAFVFKSGPKKNLNKSSLESRHFGVITDRRLHTCRYYR
jgi:hypothetical protein